MCNRYGRYSGIAIENIILGSSQAGFRILFGILVLSNINGLILGTTLAQMVTAIFLFYISPLYQEIQTTLGFRPTENESHHHKIQELCSL